MLFLVYQLLPCLLCAAFGHIILSGNLIIVLIILILENQVARVNVWFHSTVVDGALICGSFDFFLQLITFGLF